MEELQALFKRRGFVYPGSEIYGGVANTYDYGPVGTEMLRNVKNLWWKFFVQKRSDMVGLDASLISHQRIWEASGHTASFADAYVDCKTCRTRIRADHLIEDYLEKLSPEDLKAQITTISDIDQEKRAMIIHTRKVEGLSESEMEQIVIKSSIPCPKCGEHNWTPVRKFNQLFPVQLGIVEGDQGVAYLRGETAQGMFVAFDSIVNSTRVKLPFGVAQVGKSFRNEITLGNSVFRTIEFEQAEIEYFFDPNKSNWEELFQMWKDLMWKFAVDVMGIREENLRWREHSDDERSFYSKMTVDLEYKFPFGFKELWGLSYRTDYDLKQHEKFSGKDLKINDPETNEKITPHVIEPAVGINRLFLMALIDGYEVQDARTILKLKPILAPYKVAVFPLLKNKPELIAKAEEVYKMLQEKIDGKIIWDDRGNIGKRYLSQDEIGTPWCVTVDFDTLQDNTVTIRERDDATQQRVAISDLAQLLQDKIV